MTGALPLPILEKKIDAWIAATKACLTGRPSRPTRLI